MSAYEDLRELNEDLEIARKQLRVVITETDTLAIRIAWPAKGVDLTALQGRLAKGRRAVDMIRADFRQMKARRAVLETTIRGEPRDHVAETYLDRYLMD